MINTAASALAYLTTIVFIVVISTGITDIILALRAKRRIKEALSDNIESNPTLKRLAEHASSGLNEQELSEATRIISQSLMTMTKNDQRLISRGLNQGNKAGEMRYVSDLMTF
jgi:hypothetical protein